MRFCGMGVNDAKFASLKKRALPTPPAEPFVGDLAGADRSVRMPDGVVAISVFVPAVLDILRYLFPENDWLPWAARSTKFGLIGFTFST
jgi:hypothetical protein